MFELRFFLWAITLASIMTVPLQIMAGTVPENAFAGCFQWLFILLVTILVRRRLAARKMTEPPRHRISNATLLWVLLFLSLSLGMHYWRQQESPMVNLDFTKTRKL